jgi:hypothetical protein
MSFELISKTETKTLYTNTEGNMKMPTSRTKTGKKTEEQLEAKRQQPTAPKNKATEEEGSHSIDHLTIMDNAEVPDTNFEPAEDIDARNHNDMTFWGGSWEWVKANTSYGDKPQDSWFVNPTTKLIGETLDVIPGIHKACHMALKAGNHQEQMNRELERHLDFLRMEDGGELVSQGLDMLIAYQNRFFESVQRYNGLCASYEIKANNPKTDDKDIEDAKIRKQEAGDQVRGWVAKLIALTEAYHAVVDDERAYNLSYDFDISQQHPRYGLLRWSVTESLRKVGKRLAKSIKSGNMDAARYNIPRPWLDEAQKENRKDADNMLSDFN